MHSETQNYTLKTVLNRKSFVTENSFKPKTVQAVQTVFGLKPFSVTNGFRFKTVFNASFCVLLYISQYSIDSIYN